MSEIDTGNPAFPITTGHSVYHPGMSLRDWLAGQALSGILAGYWANPELSALTEDVLAQQAYQAADAMLAARQLKRPEGM
jgi:hypothetical protein